jgi:hypothetical protein
MMLQRNICGETFDFVAVSPQKSFRFVLLSISFDICEKNYRGISKNRVVFIRIFSKGNQKFEKINNYSRLHLF